MAQVLEQWIRFYARKPPHGAHDGVRDPEAICKAYITGEPGPTRTCLSDGHYLCYDCFNIKVCKLCGMRDGWCEC